MSRFLPMTPQETDGPLDVILITGDAYVDHPAWGVAAIGRWLEHHGFSVGIIAQPDWRGVDAFRRLGRPRLFFGVTAGNMDTMVNKYTAACRIRRNDAYAPGGEAGLRPDRATIPYTSRVRQAYPGVPVVVGGVEASLRRLVHFDFWQDRIRGSILLDAKADLLVFGNGELPIIEIARRLAGGASIKACRDIPGTAYALGAKDTAPTGPDTLTLPSLADCRSDPLAFNRVTVALYRESNPDCGKTLVQLHGTRSVVCNPSPRSMTTSEFDAVYELPYARSPHPCYREPIPALESITGSVTVNRGCSGGCSFCALTLHQGKDIVSRSHDSVIREMTQMTRQDGFKGIISDVGGPTANMYHMRCTDESAKAVCRRVSCLHPKICKFYGTDHKPYLRLLRAARRLPGIRKVLVNSGIRYDLAALDDEFVEELTLHHTPGQLSVAPEHASTAGLDRMRKPGIEYFSGDLSVEMVSDFQSAFVSSTPTGVLTVPLVLAIVLFGATIVAGSRVSGIGGFWLSISPAMDGPLKLMQVILWPIELLGLFIKHAVLAIRLFANILAGHAVIALILGFIKMAVVKGDDWVFFAVLPASIAGQVGIGLLELFVAFLQAYIFAFLATLFISTAVHPH